MRQPCSLGVLGSDNERDAFALPKQQQWFQNGRNVDVRTDRAEYEHALLQLGRHRAQQGVEVALARHGVIARCSRPCGAVKSCRGPTGTMPVGLMARWLS